MRIISDFHDYYDGIQAIDQDRSLIYHRKVEERYDTDKKRIFEEFPCKDRWLDYYTNSFSYNYSGICVNIVQYMIGFCGKIYPCLSISTTTDFKNYSQNKCYDIEQVDEAILPHLNKKYSEIYKSPKPKQTRFNKSYLSYLKKNVRYRYNLMSFFEDINLNNEPEHINNLLSVNPIVVWGSSNYNYLVINGRLDKYDFFRVFDTFQAYQEIKMFLGNLAVPNKPIPQIPDETMAEIKGFDKFSFRKDKQTKNK